MNPKPLIVASPTGKHAVDSDGSPVGVVRMDPAKSYAGVGELLREHIDQSSPEAWNQIKARIDYTYENLDFALGLLDRETEFCKDIGPLLEQGQKLLFKPNLVNPANIDPQTHGPDAGSTTCTEWPFVAALMRWFHDKLGVSYYEMCLGEAATCLQALASLYSLLNGQPVTPEAVIEGKAADFIGGWGFYFVRRYLSESLRPSDSDDPMNGYEESVAGKYIPPGRVTDKLMVYDLNRIFDDASKGRDIEVPGGVNYKSITLHKAVVGGAPEDADDLKAYPGCILVNVPKLKVHSITLLTNAVKNLGIGLYPMQAAKAGQCKWDYSLPHAPIPGMKGGIPHQVWVSEIDPETGIPRRDASGEYIVRKTGGIAATMADIIAAVRSQKIFMIHVVDAIEAINMDHTGMLPGTKEAEGMVFSSLDPVAADLLCARYMFSNVPLEEAVKVESGEHLQSNFLQLVPVPTVEGQHISTRTGYDSPLSRDTLLKYAETRGLGNRSYYVVGRDGVSNRPLVSLQGHLGTLSRNKFSDLVTKTLYFDAYKFPWDMQLTSLSYLAAVDKLTQSTLKQDFLRIFDEDDDGVVTYDDFGRRGFLGPMLYFMGEAVTKLGTSKYGYLQGFFTSGAARLKLGNSAWNPEGHDMLKDAAHGVVCFLAYRMSQMEIEMPDPFMPSLTWGSGKWPSYELASYVLLGLGLYGAEFPNQISFPSLYGFAFRYADLTQNEGRYAGRIRSQPTSDAISNYVSEVTSGSLQPLDFTFFVPPGYDNVAGSEVPNVEMTTDPAKVFTASFARGKEIWAVMDNA